MLGQVFTPPHIAALMARLLDITADDHVLDAACGEGALLRASAGRLFGIEFDAGLCNTTRENLHDAEIVHMDARSEEAGEWIRSKPITKVIMNPPFETKYGCMKIVENVLDNVKPGTACAFILPDKKLEKASKKQMKRILANHRITKIIKLPEPLFFGVGVTTSLFFFTTGEPQGNKDIYGFWLEDDGLETVKNKGRQDVRGRWDEDHWFNIIQSEAEGQRIDPSKHLSYQMPQKPFEITEEDFRRTAMDYILYQKGIDAKEFKRKLLNAVLYSSKISSDGDGINIRLKRGI